MNWFGLFHIKKFWVHEYWDFYHTMQSEVRCCLSNCVFWICILQLIFFCATPFILLLIDAKKTSYNCVVYASDLLLIIYIYPWDIHIKIFHGYFYFIYKKVGNICLVFKTPSSLTLTHLHRGFSFFNVVRMKK